MCVFAPFFESLQNPSLGAFRQAQDIVAGSHDAVSENFAGAHASHGQEPRFIFYTVSILSASHSSASKIDDIVVAEQAVFSHF